MEKLDNTSGILTVIYFVLLLAFIIYLCINNYMEDKFEELRNSIKEKNNQETDCKGTCEVCTCK